jgi:hypothetical protein
VRQCKAEDASISNWEIPFSQDKQDMADTDTLDRNAVYEMGALLHMDRRQVVEEERGNTGNKAWQVGQLWHQHDLLSVILRCYLNHQSPCYRIQPSRLVHHPLFHHKETVHGLVREDTCVVQDEVVGRSTAHPEQDICTTEAAAALDHRDASADALDIQKSIHLEEEDTGNDV